MATSDNFEGTLAMVAPAGGVTVGTPVYNSTSKQVCLPMTAATSGNTYSAKVVGLVKTVAKLTGVAWVQGRSLRWISSTSRFAVTTATTQISQGSAAAAAAAGDTTGDVILRFPVPGVA
jgi:predicted RecA/RadA family phage recombinase